MKTALLDIFPKIKGHFMLKTFLWWRKHLVSWHEMTHLPVILLKLNTDVFNIINYTYSLLTAPPWSQSHGLQPSMSLDRPQCCGCKSRKQMFMSNKRTKAERKVSRVSVDPYPTLITVVSFDEAFAEAASCVWITRLSSWQHSQRITGTSCQNAKRSNRINCISLSDCSYCMFIYTEYVCVYFHLKFCGITMIFYYYCLPRTKSLQFFYPKIPQMYILTCWN